MKRAALNLNLNAKQNRQQVFLEQMEQVVPWAALVELIAPYCPEGKTGRRPFSLHTMRILFMQLWFTQLGPSMEDAFLITPLHWECAMFDEFAGLPNESTFLRLRRLLEKHKLAKQILSVANDPKRLAVQGRYRSGCHPDCSATVHQEQRQYLRPGHTSSSKGTAFPA